MIAGVNALVVRDGLTVIARLGELPPLGQIDVTLEATAYGGVLALRALVVIACFALHSRGGRPGRAAARVPPPLVPLGADRRAGDPHGPGARARRPPLPRRPALPARAARLAARRWRGR